MPSPEFLESEVVEIRTLHGSLAQLIFPFRQVLEQADDAKTIPSQRSTSYWVNVAFTDSLTRLRLFLEQNFNYIEPMGLLAVMRYVFEMTVWLTLMTTDKDYGSLYYRELVDGQKRYYKDLQDQLRREVDFLRKTAADEDRSRKSEVEGTGGNVRRTQGGRLTAKPGRNERDRSSITTQVQPLSPTGRD